MPDKKPQSRKPKKKPGARKRPRPRITKNDVEAARVTTSGANYSKLIQTVRSLGITFIVFYFGIYKPVQTIAENLGGVETSVAVAFLTDVLSENWAISVSLSLNAIITATIYLQRKYFHGIKEALVKRIAELEKELDPSRTSSGLNPDGSHDLDD